MQTLRFSTMINAPREKVWRTMLGEDTYPEWTEPFSPGSHFEGEWKEGAKMLFLGPDPEGGPEGGMVSRIKTLRPHEYVSIEHLGIVKNGVEDTTSDEARRWAPAYENYTLKETPEGTEVLIEADTDDEYVALFGEMWPKALASLKELSEKQEGTLRRVA